MYGGSTDLGDGAAAPPGLVMYGGSMGSGAGAAAPPAPAVESFYPPLLAPTTATPAASPADSATDAWPTAKSQWAKKNKMG